MGGRAAGKWPQIPSPVTCAAMGTFPTAPGSRTARRKGLIINSTLGQPHEPTPSSALALHAAGAGERHWQSRRPRPNTYRQHLPQGHPPPRHSWLSLPQGGCCGAQPCPTAMQRGGCHEALPAPHSPAPQPCNGAPRHGAARQEGRATAPLARPGSGREYSPTIPPSSHGAMPTAALTLWKAEETMWWISEDTWEWVMVPAWHPGMAGLALLLLAGTQGTLSGQHNLGAKRGAQGHGRCSPAVAMP